MPVTRRELNISMLIYEVVITISAIVILSTSMSVAVLIDSGMKLFTRVICNIVFTSITAYFILEFLFVLQHLYDFLDWIRSKIFFFYAPWPHYFTMYT